LPSSNNHSAQYAPNVYVIESWFNGGGLGSVPRTMKDWLFIAAVSAQALSACGSDSGECDEIGTAGFAATDKGGGGDQSIGFVVKKAFSVEHQAVLFVRALGPEKGLTVSYESASGAQKQCESAPASADSHCTLRIHVDPNPYSTYDVPFQGSAAGDYEIEGDLVDYSSAERSSNLICTTKTHIIVR
jgi:hypothetical protein